MIVLAQISLTAAAASLSLGALSRGDRRDADRAAYDADPASRTIRAGQIPAPGRGGAGHGRPRRAAGSAGARAARRARPWPGSRCCSRRGPALRRGLRRRDAPRRSRNGARDLGRVAPAAQGSEVRGPGHRGSPTSSRASRRLRDVHRPRARRCRGRPRSRSSCCRCSRPSPRPFTARGAGSAGSAPDARRPRRPRVVAVSPAASLLGASAAVVAGASQPSLLGRALLAL